MQFNDCMYVNVPCTVRCPLKLIQVAYGYLNKLQETEV